MHSNKYSFFLADETATKALAAKLAKGIETLDLMSNGFVIYLEGDLGAGKSFLSRALIQSFIPNQKVKSPTYTLVESYETNGGWIQHFDLYRLCDPEELEFLGIRDLLANQFLALIEWPVKGEGYLPDADINIQLEHSPNGLENGGENERQIVITVKTDKGLLLVKSL